ncbi:MAG: oligosaccharide flippase family protein [Solirubrobacterales bacterium]
MAASTAAETPPGSGEDSTAKEEMHTSIRGSMLLLAGRVIALGVEFAAQVLVVRYLSQNAYGAFSYALAIAYLLAGIVVLGLPETMARYTPIYLEHRQHHRLLGAIIVAIAVVVTIGLVAFAVVVALADPLADALDSDDAARLLGILMLLVPLDGLNLIFQGIFAALGRVRTIFVRQYVLVPGLKFGVSLALVIGGKGTTFLAAGYVLVSAVGVLWYSSAGFPFLRRALARSREKVRDRVELPAKEILSFALPVLLTNVFWIALLAAGTITLGVLSSTKQVAEFEAVLPPARLNYLVTAIFAILFIPTISRLYAREDMPGLRRTYMHTTYWLTTLTVPLLALTGVFAPVFVPTFFGVRYDASIPILILLALGYYIHSTVGPNSNTLKVFRRLSVTVRLDLAALALGIGLNIALIPVWGALGAAMAFLLAVTIRNVAYHFALRKIAGISIVQRDYVRLQLTVAVALGVLVAIQVFAHPNIVIAAFLSGLAGLAVMRACRDILDVEGTFPELLRGPLRGFLGSKSA